jgi:hypothetical protein
VSSWYYLSFVDDDRPRGSRWLGGCCVEADSPIGAVQEAWRRGCNPGGEVGIWGPFPKPPGGDAVCNVIFDRHTAEHLYDGVDL